MTFLRTNEILHFCSPITFILTYIVNRSGKLFFFSPLNFCFEHLLGHVHSHFIVLQYKITHRVPVYLQQNGFERLIDCYAVITIEKVPFFLFLSAPKETLD